MKIENQGKNHIIAMEEDDTIQLTVPASVGRSCVYLEVAYNGKLRITGGSSIIEMISGEGMRGKVAP